jgi:hypothetical protein
MEVVTVDQVDETGLVKLVIEVGVLVLVEFVDQVGNEVLDGSVELIEGMN